MQYITDLLECGEITRDYGVKQKVAKIEENSGKNLKILNGIWICGTTAVGLYISLNQLTDLIIILLSCKGSTCS